MYIYDEVSEHRISKVVRYYNETWELQKKVAIFLEDNPCLENVDGIIICDTPGRIAFYFNDKKDLHNLNFIKIIADYFNIVLEFKDGVWKSDQKDNFYICVNNIIPIKCKMVEIQETYTKLVVEGACKDQNIKIIGLK